MTYNIISTGSKGNAVQLGGSLLIDCGVSFKLLSGCYKDLKLVLLTHEHFDHIRPATVKRLSLERPTLRWGCCAWMVPILSRLVPPKQIDVLCEGEWYEYGAFQVSPVTLFHNVPNCGYRLNFDGYRVFYATDTGTLDGITCEGYNLYMVEANHAQAEIQARAAEKLEQGVFSYEVAAMQNHLSREQAEEWIYQNMGANGRYVFLHQHKEEPC